MIYLRTGANGTCKTLFTLKDVREKQLKEGRPVCWNGRFKLKPELEAEWGWKRIDFKDWEQQQDGTIFLIDECHNDLPKRPNGSAVPQHVAKLAEHRARGFDFFLITQHPANIDTFVTKLIGAPGWHQHLKRIAGGSKLTSVLQWDAVNTACEKAGSARHAQVSTRSQPKEVYAWYDSAELHTEKLRIPRTWLVIGAAAVLAPVLAVMGYRSLWNVTTGGPATKASAPAAGQLLNGDRVVQPPTRRNDGPKVMTALEYAEHSLPRFAGLPNTAPRYDDASRPVRVPYPAACVTMKSKGCRCYTQQGTLIPGVEPALCEQIVETGYFVDFDAGGGIGANAPDGDRSVPSSIATNAGASVGQAQRPPRLDEQDDVGITAADIARTSNARSGFNRWARPGGVAPDTAASAPARS